MADNKSNSEVKENNTTTSGAASAKKAKEEPREKVKEENLKPDGAADKPKEKQASDTFDRAKNSTEKIVGQALGKVKETAASIVDEQRSGLAAGITGIADTVRQIGENLNNDDQNQIAALAGNYGGNLADQIERFSEYVEDRQITEVIQDVETFARRNPILFVGAAFALGVLAARFLKSSGSKK